MRYYIKEKAFKIRDEYKILDQNEEPIYKVWGKLFSIKNKLEFKDIHDRVLYRAERIIFTLPPKFNILSESEQTIGRIDRKFSFHKNYTATIEDRVYEVKGSLFGYSFDIYRNDSPIAHCERKIISIGSNYTIDINDNENQNEVMFIVCLIDIMMENARNNN